MIRLGIFVSIALREKLLHVYVVCLVANFIFSKVLLSRARESNLRSLYDICVRNLYTRLRFPVYSLRLV